MNLNKRFLTSHMKLTNVPDAADVYTTAIVESGEAHPHRFYIRQIFQVTATQSAVLCYCFPKQPLPKREKYSLSTTMHLNNTDRFMSSMLWQHADCDVVSTISNQAASTSQDQHWYITIYFVTSDDVHIVIQTWFVCLKCLSSRF